jgi:hypothetical protein
MKKSGSGCGSFIFGVLIIGCIVYSLYTHFFADTFDLSGKDRETDISFEIGDNDLSGFSSTAFSDYNLPQNRKMYNQLDSYEKDLYKQIRKGLAQGDSRIYFYSVDINLFHDAIYQAYDAVYFDFPEFFWMTNGWKYDGNQNSDGTYTVYFDPYLYEYWSYVSNKGEVINSVLYNAKQIAHYASLQETDYDKIKYIHDFIISYAEYDYVCLEESGKTVQKASSQQAHTILGCLLNRSCVCDGYSKSFKLICDLIGLEAELVLGDAGGGHAWNYVVLDGEEYWMDLTWDENEVEDQNGNLLAPYGATYNYFCVTDEHLYETHTPDDYFEIPVCDSSKYNFFLYENSYLEKYDFDSVNTAIENQYGSQIVQIKFSSFSELEKAWKEIVEKKKYKDLNFGGNTLIDIYYSKKQLIIFFYLY